VIRALLLDLDNTLIDRDAAVLDWLHEVLPGQAGGALDALLGCDRGGHGARPAFFARLGALAGLPVSVVRRRFGREVPPRVRLKPDADALLRGFRGRTVIVTNGPGRLQRAKVAAAGLEERVDHVLVSGECGAHKPDAAIFHRALELAGCAAGDALMIGDHPVIDVAGARAVGIAAVMVRTRWFDEVPGTRAVDLLTELAL
jgi:putative hydrolase of the HAD superfamily